MREDPPVCICAKGDSEHIQSGRWSVLSSRVQYAHLMQIHPIAAEGLNLLTVVLRSGEAPALTRPQVHRVMQAHRAHAEYLQQRADLADSDDDDGPQDDDAWLYEDLTILAKLYSQLRDKEQIIELIFEVSGIQ